MPIPVQRLPPPQLERSLVPYTVVMMNRICDALLKAFGGDFQTGITSFAATGLVSIGFNTSFPSVFNHTDGPVVLVSPTGNLDQWLTYVGFTNNNAFSIFGTTQTGAAATGPFSARWVAWYP